MKHIYQAGKDINAPTFVLLHGTGGNEHDLLPIANMIAPDASILGVRGNVLENGMPRFFRRLAEGIFDEEDLIFRTNELNEFLNEAAEKYEFDRERLVAIGYSNGANIAASLMYHLPNVLHGAILFHAMVPRRGIHLPDLSNTHIFIGAGTNDPIIPQQETKELIETLRNANAIVEEHWGHAGHQLTRDEVEKAREWYTRLTESK